MTPLTISLEADEEIRDQGAEWGDRCLVLGDSHHLLVSQGLTQVGTPQ